MRRTCNVGVPPFANRKRPSYQKVWFRRKHMQGHYSSSMEYTLTFVKQLFQITSYSSPATLHRSRVDFFDSTECAAQSKHDD